MQMDGYTLVLLLFIFATLFSAGTGSSYGDFAPIHAVAALVMIPVALFAALGSGLMGLLLAFALLMWFGDKMGEGVVTVALFAFVILLLGG